MRRIEDRSLRAARSGYGWDLETGFWSVMSVEVQDVKAMYGKSVAPDFGVVSDDRLYRYRVRQQVAKWFDRHAKTRTRWRERNAYYHSEVLRLARQVIPPGAGVATWVRYR